MSKVFERSKQRAEAISIGVLGAQWADRLINPSQADWGKACSPTRKMSAVVAWPGKEDVWEDTRRLAFPLAWSSLIPCPVALSSLPSQPFSASTTFHVSVGSVFFPIIPLTHTHQLEIYLLSKILKSKSKLFYVCRKITPPLQVFISRKRKKNAKYEEIWQCDYVFVSNQGHGRALNTSIPQTLITVTYILRWHWLTWS